MSSIKQQYNAPHAPRERREREREREREVFFNTVKKNLETDFQVEKEKKRGVGRGLRVAGIENCSFSGSSYWSAQKKPKKVYRTNKKIKGLGLHKTNTPCLQSNNNTTHPLHPEERERERGFFNTVKKKPRNELKKKKKGGLWWGAETDVHP